jgi:hypothetical protein
MKEALAFIGVLALAASLWFAKGYSDEKIFKAKDESIQSLQKVTQLKEDILSKNEALIDSKDVAIKLLQDHLSVQEDIFAKGKVLIDSQSVTIKSLQNAIKSNEETISKDNDLIASCQKSVAEFSRENDLRQKNAGVRIYPADNGFEAQDLGSEFFSYQVFGPCKNPNNVPLPDKLPNRTPWKFGDGNSGVAANGSGYGVTGATNLDSDGSTSKSGQAGSLEYAGSFISQVIKLPAGTFTVTFAYESRVNYGPNQITVSIDGTELFKGTPDDSPHFKQITTNSITFAAPGKHKLMFRGLGGSSQYPCTFIDDIYLNVVGSQGAPSSPQNVDVGTDGDGITKKWITPKVVQKSPEPTP